MRNIGSRSQVVWSLLALAVLGCVPHGTARSATSTSPAQLSQIVLARAGDGAPVFRIPALTVTSAGSVLAAYDARPSGSDLPSHIAVMLRRSTDGGRTFAQIGRAHV